MPMNVPTIMAEMYYRLFVGDPSSLGSWNLYQGSMAHDAMVGNTIGAIRERARRLRALLNEQNTQKLSGYRFVSAVPGVSDKLPDVDRSGVNYGIDRAQDAEPRMINNVYSPTDGIVIGGGLGEGFGPFYLLLQTSAGLVLIGHLDPSTIHLLDGEEVWAGQYLGEYSETPQFPSDAPHVHLELRPDAGLGYCSQNCGPIDWSMLGWRIPTGPGGRLTSGYIRNDGYTFHGGYDYVHP
jgi:murein DD-endopeptidase MepM/ murein hydrolase activator NlpD